MYQPWLAHSFPGVTLEQLERGYWTLSAYIAMADYVRRSPLEQ
jgi:hypothetical protein